MIRVLFFILLAAFASGTAQAQWREASSPNFLVYGEMGEKDLRRFAEKLEKFDFLLRRIHNVNAPASSNRLRIILVPNQAAVADLAGAPGAPIAGYYVRDARGMLMVGSRNRVRGPAGGDRGENRAVYMIDPESVLLHEYTHHFMYQYFPATYPTWYSEGFAEFWGATHFRDDGVVEIGLPAEHRFGSFFGNRWLDVSQLLEAQSYADVAEVDLLYAMGWLLVRYTWDSKERKQQLQRYLALINQGVGYRDAARQAFGDLGRLNGELRRYSRRSKFDVVQLPLRSIDFGQISVRPLSGAEQALFRYEIELSQGVSNADFQDFAARLRREAARFPDDPFALRLLAEVERTASNQGAARAAVERLLAAAPEDPRGLALKGLIALEPLRRGEAVTSEEIAAARRHILRAAKLQPNDPIILEALYDSHGLTGRLPPDEAQAALYRAMELAPSDPRLRMKVAADFEQRGMIPEAIAIIRPDAFRTPHSKNESERERKRRQFDEDRNRRAGTARPETAREMLERLTAMQSGQTAAGASR